MVTTYSNEQRFNIQNLQKINLKSTRTEIPKHKLSLPESVLRTNRIKV